MNADRRSEAPGPADPSLYEKAAELARDTLVDQLAELDSMRARSVQFLAFVGTATAFLVGTTVSGKTERGVVFGVVGIVASLGFIPLLLLLKAILTGTVAWWGGGGLMEWQLRTEPQKYIQWLDQNGSRVSPAHLYRNLVDVYEEEAKANETYLGIIRKRYVGFLALATAELAFWAVLAWSFGGGR